MAGITDNFRLLDGPIGINERRAEDAKNRAIKNNSLSDKQTLRLGRRAYRAALKGQDPSNYIKGMNALEDMRMTIGTTGAGIKMAGVGDAAGQQRFQNVQRSIGLAGSPSSNIGLAGSGGSNIGLAGSAGSNIGLAGSAGSNIGTAGSQGSNVGLAGSEGSNIGLAGSQKSNITLPANDGREIVGSKTSTGEKFLSGKVELKELGAKAPDQSVTDAIGNSSTPASRNLTPEELASVEMKSQSLSERDAQAKEESDARGAFGTGNSPFLDKILNPRKAFAEDLLSSNLIENRNPEAIANAYARGESLGVSRNQVNSFLGLPAEDIPVETSAQAESLKNGQRFDSLVDKISEEYKNDPRFRGLDLSKLKSLPLGEKESSQAIGKKAAEDYDAKTTDVLGRSRDSIQEIRPRLQGIIDVLRKPVSNETKDRVPSLDKLFKSAQDLRGEYVIPSSESLISKDSELPPIDDISGIMGIQTAEPVQPPIPPSPPSPETQDASTQNQPSGPSGLNVKFGEMPFNEKTSPAEKYRRLIANGYTEKQAAELAGIQNKSNAGIFEGSLMGNLFNKLNSF